SRMGHFRVLGGELEKLLFVHDHTFTLVDGAVYSSGAFPSWAWERYLSGFQSVTVAARKKQFFGDPDLLKIDLSEKEGVSFDFFPSLSNVSGLLLGGGGAGDRLKNLV